MSNQKIMIQWTLAFALFAGGCSTPSPKPAEEAPILVKSAPRSSSSGFQLRDFQEETLTNGLRILWIPDSTLPRVGLHLLIAVGESDEKSGQEGLNSLLASLFDQGTSKLKARSLAEELDQSGSEFNRSIGRDYTVLSLTGLATQKPKVIELFSQIVQMPAFADEEVQRQRMIYLARLKKLKDEPSAVADEKLDELIFAGTSYGHTLEQKRKSLSSLQRADLLRFYYSFYRPNNSILAVVGAFSANDQNLIRQSFQNWPKADVLRDTAKFPEMEEAQSYLVHKPGLAQTQIRWGQMSLPRNHPDYLALRLGNLILGGGFVSRLNQRVRDDLGLTYSIQSSISAQALSGSFEISTFTRHEKVTETLQETQKIVNELLEKGVTEVELAAAKNLLIGQFPFSLETADRTAMNLMVYRRYGLSDDELRFFQKNVQKMELKQVNEAIRKWIKPSQLNLVIYTDSRKTGKQLSEILPKLKKISVDEI